MRIGFMFITGVSFGIEFPAMNFVTAIVDVGIMRFIFFNTGKIKGD